MRSRCRAEASPRRWPAALAGAALVLAALAVVAPWAVPVGAPAAAATTRQTDPTGLGDEPQPDPDDVRAEADRILSGDQFDQGDDGLGGDGTGTGSGDPSSPDAPDAPQIPQPEPFTGVGAIGQVIMWILVVGLVSLAVFLIVRAVAARRRRSPEDDDDEDDDVEVVEEEADELDPRLRPADEWRRLAGEQEAAGRWREGLRSRYRALLADLIDRRVILDVAGATTGELRVEVAGTAPGAAADFAAASDLFDRAWYGARPTGAAERDRFVDHERVVLDRARTPAGALVGAGAGTDGARPLAGPA